MRRSSDPKRIEEFLLQQEGILDASVWYGGEHLRAHVTPMSHYAVCAVSLREACEKTLGECQTPETILVLPRQ